MDSLWPLVHTICTTELTTHCAESTSSYHSLPEMFLFPTQTYGTETGSGTLGMTQVYVKLINTKCARCVLY